MRVNIETLGIAFFDPILIAKIVKIKLQKVSRRPNPPLMGVFGTGNLPVVYSGPF